MKRMCKVLAMALSMSLLFATSVYAKNDGYVGATLGDVKKHMEANNSEFEIVYKYETREGVGNDVILSQTYDGNVMTVVVNNTSNVGIEYENPNVSDTNSFKTGNCDIVMDGNYSDWNTLPISYEYNWDNSENCWYSGEWKNGICYKTPEGTYDNNVRHGMQLYCDGQYVYLHIKFARIYDPSFNEADYRFYIDGEMAAFSFDMMNGFNLQDVRTISAGTYQMKVRHRDSYTSYLPTSEATAYLTVYDNKECSDFEIQIPLSAMKEQNQNISMESVGTIEFYNPNLMYRKISCVGTSTGPVLFACLTVLTVGAGAVIGGKVCKKNKKSKEEK